MLHKCKGRFGSCTHTGVEVIEAVEGSKEGDQGSKKKPEPPRRHGPLPEIRILSYGDSKTTAKNSQAKGLIDKPCTMRGFHISVIQECRYTR